jgi:tetratricopeptide (TPR) repeat protein
MKRIARISVSAAALLVLASTVGCAKLKARDQLVKGVQSFKAGHFEDAVDHFQNSINLDPDYDIARLDLAAAYSSQVVPNLDTPDNLKVAHQALDQFNIVLSKNPHDIIALRQIASIHRNIKLLDEARSDEQKVIAEDPNDDAAYYTIGVIDWSQAYKNATTTLAANNLVDDGLGNAKKSKDVCTKLQQQNGQLVASAEQNLNKAIEINPTYSDAMDYLNLTYRRKAELECDDDNARKADLAKADDWVVKATGARKANEKKLEEKNQGGVEMK